MSCFTSRMAATWSAVSTYGNDASSSVCHAVSGGKAWPSRDLARGVQLQQLLRQVLHGAAHARLRARPLLRPEARQRRPMLARADVAADAVDLLRRHEEAVAVGVVQLQELALVAADVLAHEAGEPRDAVLDVDDVLARRSRSARNASRDAAAARRRAALLAEAEDLGVSEQRQPARSSLADATSRAAASRA